MTDYSTPGAMLRLCAYALFAAILYIVGSGVVATNMREIVS